ncbi:class I SAM-dependent methyltransferase [Calditrichota bacterium]
MHEVMRLIHDKNPYENFPFRNFEFNPHGWGGNLPIFREFIDQYNPEIIVEVGSWLGQSTTNMAEYIKDNGLNTKIIAIDTWLGGEEHWEVPAYKKMLNLHHGYPQLYFQFLANILHKDVQDIVVPFPVTSLIGARFLARKGVKSNMIYIDASHDEIDVYLDLIHLQPLLPAKNWVMFGDDYEPGWQSVMDAVDKFGKETGQKVENHNKVWVIRG